MATKTIFVVTDDMNHNTDNVGTYRLALEGVEYEIDLSAHNLARTWRGRMPVAWVDLASVVWLGTDEAVLTGTDTGHVPPRLRKAFDDLLARRRDSGPVRSAPPRRPDPADLITPWRYTCRSQPQGARFSSAQWSVAVVDVHS